MRRIERIAIGLDLSLVVTNVTARVGHLDEIAIGLGLVTGVAVRVGHLDLGEP